MFPNDDWASPLRTDPEISFDPTGWIGFVVNCTTTIYDIEYSINNGNLSLDMATDTNSSVAELMMMHWWYLDTGYISLEQQVQLAIMESSVESMANKVAEAISKITVAVASGIMSADYTLYHQNRSTVLVTRVEKAPLYALVASNLLLALVGIVLAGFAYTSLDRVSDVQGVQVRLGFNGLLAQMFESRAQQEGEGKIEDLFEERGGDGRKKVAVSWQNGMLTFVACSS